MSEVPGEVAEDGGETSDLAGEQMTVNEIRQFYDEACVGHPEIKRFGSFDRACVGILLARIKELEAALRPFADYVGGTEAHSMSRGIPDHQQIGLLLDPGESPPYKRPTFKDLRRVAEVLRK